MNLHVPILLAMAVMPRGQKQKYGGGKEDPQEEAKGRGGACSETRRVQVLCWSFPGRWEHTT